MLIALDVGNTHSVLGYFEENEPRETSHENCRYALKKTWRLSTHPLCTQDEFKLKLEMILQTSGVHLDPQDVLVVSSVVPAFSRIIQNAFPSRKLVFINHSWPFSFDIKANPPQHVGADRLVNAEAVVREYGFPSIIVDSGTATTLCALSKNAQGKAEYLGGAIIPGIEMSMEALAKNTAQLFTVELTPPLRTIGANTQDALKSGMVLGYASMIDGMVKRFKSELGVQNIPVVATGGISNLMKGITQELTHFDPDLTLKGIAYLYEEYVRRN